MRAPWRISSFAGAALALLTLPGLVCSVGCGRSATDAASESTHKQGAEPQSAPADYTAEAQAWADSVASSMSVEELAGQLLMPALYATTNPANIAKARQYLESLKVGGFVWLKGSAEEMLQLADTLSKLSSTPLFMALDAEWGAGMRLSGCTSFKKNYQLSGLPEKAFYAMGRTTGREAAAVGINMIFAPVLDVAPSERSVMWRRSYGPDPERVATAGQAFARGIVDEGLIPVGKHFPGHGATHLDSHKTIPLIADSRTKLDTVDLIPFRSFISSGFPALMTAHVIVPSLDGGETSGNGQEAPATLSHGILTALLRDRLGFDGLVISDAMNMLPARKGIFVEALKAGCDILTVPVDPAAAVKEVAEAISDGTLPVKEIRAKVARILFYKYPLR